jgi:hypothetical protein
MSLFQKSKKEQNKKIKSYSGDCRFCCPEFHPENSHKFWKKCHM